MNNCKKNEVKRLKAVSSSVCICGPRTMHIFDRICHMPDRILGKMPYAEHRFRLMQYAISISICLYWYIYWEKCNVRWGHAVLKLKTPA
jgi:uncharacterized protein (DUF486 family)